MPVRFQAMKSEEITEIGSISFDTADLIFTSICSGNECQPP